MIFIKGLDIFRPLSFPIYPAPFTKLYSYQCWHEFFTPGMESLHELFWPFRIPRPAKLFLILLIHTDRVYNLIL